MTLDNEQNGLILVWAQIGKKLKDKDENRLFAICQKDCDYYLSSMYNDDILKIINDVVEKGLTDSNSKKIKDLNEVDTLFREIHDYFESNEDNLSVGSLITGELDKSDRFGVLIKKKSENDNNE